MKALRPDIVYVGAYGFGQRGRYADDPVSMLNLHQLKYLELARAAGLKAVPTGIDHGTVTVVAERTPVEVTTLRRDVATDGRRATIAYTGDWREDAARRDFTINALSADPDTGELFDYFGGLADLEARRVRFIGDPLQRIAEDHLRILRFFRFHAKFGAGTPDPEGLAACAARANDLMALSRERIADELLKLLALPDPAPTVRLMIDRGILKPVLPEIADPARLAALVEAERAAGIAPEPVRRLGPDGAARVEPVGGRRVGRLREDDQLALQRDRREQQQDRRRHCEPRPHHGSSPVPAPTG